MTTADEWTIVGYTNEDIMVVYDELPWYEMIPPVPTWTPPPKIDFESMASYFAATITSIGNDVECPLCTITKAVYHMIIHLNDDHEMPREDIADWLDMLPYDFTVKG